MDFIWRYDSGLVVSGVPDAAAALVLTPNQQVDIGLTCDWRACAVHDVARVWLTVDPADTAADRHRRTTTTIRIA